MAKKLLDTKTSVEDAIPDENVRAELTERLDEATQLVESIDSSIEQIASLEETDIETPDERFVKSLATFGKSIEKDRRKRPVKELGSFSLLTERSALKRDLETL